MRFDPLDYSSTDTTIAAVTSYSQEFEVVAMNGPRQQNMVDCGVYVFAVASSTLLGRPVPLEVIGLEVRRETRFGPY
jgi:Ulp1 family protease